jgi:hypothetical protein
MEKLNEFIQLPYCYNLQEEFLMTKGKLDKNTVPVSLGQKMSELATCIGEMINDLVSEKIYNTQKLKVIIIFNKLAI